MQDVSNSVLPDDEDIFVTLDMDDGTQAECEIITIFDLGDQDYIVLMPLDEAGEEHAEGTVYIFRYFEDEEGNLFFYQDSILLPEEPFAI